MIHLHDYRNQCWWCGEIANSSEHKYKKSDLIREFGKGPYKEKSSIVRVIQGNEHIIQGPNSNEVKFGKNIYHTCNTYKSQAFDLAYDKFNYFIKNNEKEILKTNQFMFSDIFGSYWQEDREQVVRYFVKHICCRLASSNVFISENVINYLNGGVISKGIILSMEMRSDIAVYLNHTKSESIQNGALWLGDVMYMLYKVENTMSEAKSFIGYRWLRLNYIYDEDSINYEDNFSGDLVVLKPAYIIHPYEMKIKLLLSDVNYLSKRILKLGNRER